MEFLKLLNECKKENELLESRLCSLEASHAHLSSLNEQLQEPLNPNRTEKAKPTTSHQDTNQNPTSNNQAFQPIRLETPIQPLQHQLPKTPTKQTINSLLISASPISSASSPNNSSLQSISFGTPPTHSLHHHSHTQNKSAKKSLTPAQPDFYNNVRLNQNTHNQHITSALVNFLFATMA